MESNRSPLTRAPTQTSPDTQSTQMQWAAREREREREMRPRPAFLSAGSGERFPASAFASGP